MKPPKIIPSTWLEQPGHRLDSAPYLSGAMEAKVALENLVAPKEPLHELTEGGVAGIFHAGRLGREYVNDANYGVPFLGSIDILAADLSYLPLLSKRQIARSPEFLIKEGWTLITRSGTIGRMAYVRPDMAGMALSEHAMRVKPDTNKIPSGYLFAYLRSSYGVPLVVFGTYGAIVQHIEPQHIADLPVPRLGNTFETAVHQKIVEAARLRSEYQFQIRHATNQLFAAVGLKDITSGEWHGAGSDLAFSTTLKSPASFRAANFNPRFQNLCQNIESAPHKTLKEICIPGTLRRGGRYKRIDADRKFAYLLVGQKEIFWQQPEGRWVAKFCMGSDVFVQPGTTLVAAQGTLGESELYCRSEFIWGAGLSIAYSEHLLRVVADERVMPRGCLYAFMRSETAFRMLRSIAVGSKLQDHHYAFLPNLPVPYPDLNTQQAIHELVVDAYEKRHRSNVLENEAVAMVERAVLEGV